MCIRDRGKLAGGSPAPIVAFTAAGLSAKLDSSTAGQGLKQIAGTPACGVDVRYMQYGTVGCAGEATDASGVMMIPTGTGAASVSYTHLDVYKRQILHLRH